MAMLSDSQPQLRVVPTPTAPSLPLKPRSTADIQAEMLEVERALAESVLKTRALDAREAAIHTELSRLIRDQQGLTARSNALFGELRSAMQAMVGVQL